MKSSGAFFFFTAFFFFSCASGPEISPPEGNAERPSLLPLASGWYLYNFERTFKGVEDEYAFTQSTGMKMVQEVTVKQNGTVTWCEGGVLHDPVLDMYLSVDGEGRIRGIEDLTVSGALSENGAFFWSGLTEQHGWLNHVAVTGSLTPLPLPARGDSRYDGLYHLTDTGTGR
jgi:hypothetical protein